jgi:16S rRNA (uracil1498-N3)-methyltransferase
MQRIAIEPTQIVDDVVTFAAEQQRYLRKVLRLQADDRCLAIDGLGKTYLVALTAAGGKILSEIVTDDRELPVPMILVAALPKGNGFDDVIRACTELGVTQIHPIASDRSLLQPSNQRQTRWQKIATEATEQCERQIVPTIFPVRSFPATIESIGTRGLLTIATARNGSKMLPNLLATWQTTRDITANHPIVVATGPEGGWTDRELQIASDAGYTSISLGKRILRAITAPIAAMSIVAATLESPID